jgi:ribose 5-phosphate isomerase
MKENEFLMRINEDLDIKIRYALDDNGNVLIDEEGTREEFESKLNKIKGVLE